MNKKFGLEEKHDAQRGRHNLKKISRLYAETKLDGSFQRFGGIDKGSGWNLKQGEKYLENLLEGKVFNNIIIVDVEESLKWAKEIGDKQSETYFRQILTEEFKYVSIDGNNTSSYVSAFLNGDDRIKPFNKKIMDYSEEIQENINYSEKIDVIKLRRIGIVEMCNLFRSLNTQSSLNAQERRQARWSLLSKKIRDLGSDYRNLFKTFIFNNDANLDQRFHEEILAQLALKLQNPGSGLTSKGLDDLYRKGDDLNLKVHQQMKNTLQHIDSFVDKPLKNKLSKGTLHNLFDVTNKVLQNYKITDGKKFFAWFLENDAEFRSQCGKIALEDEEEKSYEYWTKFYYRSRNYNNIKEIFREAFRLKKDMLIKDNVIQQRQLRTSADNYSFSDKRKLFVLQDSTLRDGTPINILDLYFGKFEADHVKSVKDGGETTIENGELMLTADNRSKGANSNQPHFDFQQQAPHNPSK